LASPGRDALLRPPRAQGAAHRLDSWLDVGHIGVRMHRQGYDPQLTQDDERGWRATFYVTGIEHSPTSATGTAWQRVHLTAKSCL